MTQSSSQHSLQHLQFLPPPSSRLPLLPCRCYHSSSSHINYIPLPLSKPGPELLLTSIPSPFSSICVPGQSLPLSPLLQSFSVSVCASTPSPSPPPFLPINLLHTRSVTWLGCSGGHLSQPGPLRYSVLPHYIMIPTMTCKSSSWGLCSLTSKGTNTYT